MKLYFAPMEGVNGYIYRNAWHKCYGDIDKYITPFISPNQNHRFSTREWKDVLPEHNEGMNIVPQLLTNRAEDFIWAAGELKKLGYDEVSLNLGCPSGTVVSKGKGAGFLADKEKLAFFLDAVYQTVDIRVSIKTRIGRTSPEEFYELMELYNRYPVYELTIHPRIQTDMYKNHPNLSVFREAVLKSKCPVCYNGDIFTTGDYERLIEGFPSVPAVMLGRGLIANPALAGMIRSRAGADKERMRCLHDLVYEGYRQVISGDKNVLFKMKELWSYMAVMFTDSAPYAKKIRKAERAAAYEAAVNSLFLEQDLAEGAGFKMP